MFVVRVLNVRVCSRNVKVILELLAEHVEQQSIGENFTIELLTADKQFGRLAKLASRHTQQVDTFC